MTSLAFVALIYSGMTRRLSPTSPKEAHEQFALVGVFVDCLLRTAPCGFDPLLRHQLQIRRLGGALHGRSCVMPPTPAPASLRVSQS